MSDVHSVAHSRRYSPEDIFEYWNETQQVPDDLNKADAQIAYYELIPRREQRQVDPGIHELLETLRYRC